MNLYELGHANVAVVPRILMPRAQCIQVSPSFSPPSFLFILVSSSESVYYPLQSSSALRHY